MFFFATSAAVAPFSKLLAIYLFKGFCLAAHLLNGYLIFRLLKKDAYTERVTLAYLCNPLILFEQVGSAHVDVFVCTTFLLLIFCFKYKGYLLGVLTVWLGFMAKTYRFMATFNCGFLIQQRRWLSLLLMVMTSLGIIGLLTVTVLPTPESWQSLLNPGVEFSYSGIYSSDFIHLLGLFAKFKY
jgi:alpha-1,6-mannosyltransferase